MEVSEKAAISCFNQNDTSGFVTVVSVGSEDDPPPIKVNDLVPPQSGYVTVLKIGDEDICASSVDANVQTEEVLVYRLPGERLGFGLKFEGGTKASEFVKRLFIQSCARDSPASRVRGSWGFLTEGDEVLEIDSVPVKSMTRIDCVRCLKESNVVIKLLVTHTLNQIVSDDQDSQACTRSTEDLPLVISAEKKRTPPPPPPVPPRKIPRKLYKVESGINIVIPPKPFGDGSQTNGVHKNHYPSPRNSLRLQSRQSPEVVKRDRKLSECNIGPPDAEVYIDLFSHESNYCQSESDDTGSSISTVVDRFSLPSTPTATQKQRDLNNILNAFHQDCDDVDFVTHEYTFNHLDKHLGLNDGELIEQSEKKTKGATLQPPANFQDAPLSYGNEDVRVVEASIENESDESKRINGSRIIKTEKRRPPPPPVRSKHTITIKEKNNNNYDVTDEYSCDKDNLPRLVDFVPKPAKTECEFESVKQFLQNERISYDHAYSRPELSENEFNDLLTCNGNYGAGDFYAFNWNPSSQLATIGEDEEQDEAVNCIHNYQRSPILIVENADETDDIMETICPTFMDPPDDMDDQFDKVMDGPAINSRQPPDGHEFPDYEETKNQKPVVPVETPIVEVRKLTTHSGYGIQKDAKSVRDIITRFSNTSNTTKMHVPGGAFEQPKKGGVPKPVMNPSSLNTTYVNRSSLSFDNTTSKTVEVTEVTILDSIEPKLKEQPEAKIRQRAREIPEAKSRDIPEPKIVSHPEPRIRESIVNKDTEVKVYKFLENTDIVPVSLHTRSQSLIDLTAEQRTRHWNQLTEQRCKGLSKLKGLVISEDISENSTCTVIDLPEIKSTTPIIPITENKYPNFQNTNHTRQSTTPYLTTPIWKKDTSVSIPKYSPAFKRKSLQLYGGKISNDSKVKPYINTYDRMSQKQTFTSQTERDCGLPMSLNDAPKSLESITSPTRSDCSFEYIISSPELKPNFIKVEARKKMDEANGADESDNDSAVSSSQSSYISRNSPPASPSILQSSHTHASYNMLEHERAISSYEYNSDRRLLKPQSVEAINRKNILASAKCSSGRDLKVGSPLIQRKFDEPEQTVDEAASIEENVVNGAVDVLEANDIAKDETPVIATNIAIICDTTIPLKIAEIQPEPVKEPIIEEMVTKPDTKIRVERKTTLEPPNVTIPVPTTNGKAETVSTRIKRISATENKSTLLNNVLTDVNKSKVRNILPRSIAKNTKVASVTDLRKNYEKLTPVTRVAQPVAQTRTSVVAPAATPTKLPKTKRTEVPVVDSSKIIDDTVKECAAIDKKDFNIIVINPEFVGGSIGITLAGGMDYETKEITVHKVRNGSPAFLDGRLRKGDRILSMNGKSMTGLTHAESVAILKEPVAKVVLAIYCGKPIAATAIPTAVIVPSKNNKGGLDKPAQISRKETNSTLASSNISKKQEYVINLLKDSSGLGFSMEGGKDSPQGDKPLVIKKMFAGGLAEKCGKLLPGDELLEINGVDVKTMPRIDAWSIMKKLPAGEVILRIRR